MRCSASVARSTSCRLASIGLTVDLLARTASRCRRVYILPLWFLSFFLLYSIFDALSLRSLNGSQPNLDTYSLMIAIWKIRSELPRAFISHKKLLFGTDFELDRTYLCERNIISTIGKKSVNLRGLPYMHPKFGELWSTNGWERLASFCPTPKFSHWETLPALPHGRYITDSRQTLARVM